MLNALIDKSPKNTIKDISFNVDNNIIKNVDTILENERKTSKKETWNKLNFNEKKQKLYTYALKYTKENNLSVNETKILINYLYNILDKKLLQKIKDVTYDKEKETIVEIPSLYFNSNNKKFTLKKHDKTSILKSLNPGKTRKKIKEKIEDLEIKHEVN